ncbi:MAG: ABC transporter ATP-binding protein [Spirochaetes bacterium]|nr:ABC transporter ATP-binding protein [Spirochaetota bacterium]
MIKVNSITKTFNEITAASDLSFNIAKGEIFGIVGPDGAGKSTLLRLIAGIIIPESGTIHIKDINVAENPFLVKENLAYMPQRFGLYEDLTVEENIYFFGRLFGVSRKGIFKRMKRLYDFSRLEPFKDRLAGKLSGGMKQKLGLACSLVHNPDIILLDEPTNGVDPVSRREFWKILYDLLTDGVTIVISTAYLDEAERCTRLALMYNGSFLRLGRPSEIKKSIAGSLLEISVSDVWKAERAIKAGGNFGNIIREGSALRIFSGNPSKADADIRRIFKNENIETKSIKRKVPTLENCFLEIIHRRNF